MKKKNISIIIAIFIIGFFIYFILTFTYCSNCVEPPTRICTKSLVIWCTDCKSRNWSDITLSEDIPLECFEIGFFGNLNSNSSCVEIKALCKEKTGIT